MPPLHRMTTASRRLATGLAITLLAVFGFGAVAFASPHDSGPRKPDTPRPTIVLVHGGWDNSTGWDAVATAVQRRGFPVIAPATRFATWPRTRRTSTACSRRSTDQSCSSATPTAGPSSQTPPSAFRTSRRWSTPPAGRLTRVIRSARSSEVPRQLDRAGNDDRASLPAS